MDDIDRERQQRAQAMSVDERFLAGFELYQRSMAFMRTGARSEFPDASEEEINRIIRDRLRRLEGTAPYRP